MAPRCQLLSGSLPPVFRLLSGRPFSTSTPLLGRKGGDLGSHLPQHVIPKDANIPEYPHGPARLFKQSNRGLYGGQRIQFGNNVSPETETKTRRYWKPNVVTKGFYSIVLKKRIRLNVTSTVLKTMDREGGLDEYLLKESPARIKELGPLGWALRWTLMQQPEVIARFRAEAAALGLAQHIIDERWPQSSPARRETSQRKEQRLREEASKLRDREELSEEHATRLRSNHNRKLRLEKLASQYQRGRAAPDWASAWALAEAQMAKNHREIRSAGSIKNWVAWKKAKSSGAVAEVGSDEDWLARLEARRILIQQAKVSYRQRRGLVEEEVSETLEEEQKDEWGSLVDGKKVHSDSRPNL